MNIAQIDIPLVHILLFSYARPFTHLNTQVLVQETLHGFKKFESISGSSVQLLQYV